MRPSDLDKGSHKLSVVVQGGSGGALAKLDQYVLTPVANGKDPNLTTPTAAASRVSPELADARQKELHRNNGFDLGESVALTYHFIHSLRRFGEVDPDVYATASDGLVSSYAAFRRETSPGVFERTYVAYNYGAASRSVTFHNPGGSTVTLECVIFSRNLGRRPVGIRPPRARPWWSKPAEWS